MNDNQDEFHYGAIVKVNLSPHKGHEQAGWRPAIIISNDIFNQTNNMRMICPITHTNRHSPYHIPVNGCDETDGFIMCNQIRSLDLNARKAVYVEDSIELADKVSELIKQCLSL